MDLFPLGASQLQQVEQIGSDAGVLIGNSKLDLELANGPDDGGGQRRRYEGPSPCCRSQVFAKRLAACPELRAGAFKLTQSRDKVKNRLGNSWRRSKC
jgi:hypothetical protein